EVTAVEFDGDGGFHMAIGSSGRKGMDFTTNKLSEGGVMEMMVDRCGDDGLKEMNMVVSGCCGWIIVGDDVTWRR
nr:hypothetical protein [Tanacetum cinerariifolium]